MASRNSISKPKDPGHEYAKTEHIFFEYFDQRSSNAPFGYEHYVSLPPGYETEPEKRWPLVLFLHGAGESQRNANESYLSIRHGIPKVILCYDRVKSGKEPVISIPMANRLRKTKQAKQGDLSETAVPPEVCTLLVENFITVSPSLNMQCGYGWNASILSALLDEIVERYRVDMHRIHVTGFSMGGYGTWKLALHTPKRFASAMPICGGGDHLRASILKQIPHWIHHGDKDDIIPLQASQQMVDALEKAGAEEIQFTRYPELMHDSWTAAYNNPDVYRWMLDRRRQVQGDEKVVPDANKTTVA
ncbi:uncharacterized protein HMPREF1541_03015 [Cyphellophora europaea CBS 101466]|uniref:Phospholipase/carboxylesterase/thioesterase domain-containing protein n=1 Tax=Cyphellophora europaea (strain CBS 101466) TaxID=1220924 RepID=W2RXN2_CYPE1|nr:uncharacterized protein HMPREF1541_03015 [Cyphellophora europaea CBS 101466]ETN41080.1 hypothetical protein HMPREF1541_03015 [Cyphellophora europaea CBS 101466]